MSRCSAGMGVRANKAVTCTQKSDSSKYGICQLPASRQICIAGLCMPEAALSLLPRELSNMPLPCSNVSQKLVPGAVPNRLLCSAMLPFTVCSPVRNSFPHPAIYISLDQSSGALKSEEGRGSIRTYIIGESSLPAVESAPVAWTHDDDIDFRSRIWRKSRPKWASLAVEHVGRDQAPASNVFGRFLSPFPQLHGLTDLTINKADIN